MTKGKEAEIEDTPFNMAMLYYLRLSKLMDAADRAAITGDVVTWYSCLRSIYRNIVFKLKTPEKTDLEKKFNKVSGLLGSGRGKGSVQQKIQNMALSNAAGVLDGISCDVMLLLNKYKMIFPKIETKGGLDGLAKRYKL